MAEKIRETSTLPLKGVTHLSMNYFIQSVQNFSGYFDNYLALRSILQDILKAKVDLVTDDMISHYIKPLMEDEIHYVKTA